MGFGPATLHIPAIADVVVGASGPERWFEDQVRKQQEVHLPYTPFPKQLEFHTSPAKYRLFGGAAGPGKSQALLMETVRTAAIQYEGVKTLLLRRTFEELEGSIISKFREHVPRELYRSYNESKHRVVWHNGSESRFGYCKNAADIWQYQGHEYIFVGFDELTQFLLSQWQTIKAWNRSPKGPGRMAGATNPVGVGLQWVKALWIDKKPAPGMDQNEARLYRPEDHEFIGATLQDNPIYANDEVYKDQIRQMPHHLRLALLDGRWDILAGVYFECFDQATMTIRPEEIRMKPWWPRWISIDWGFAHDAAVYWHTLDEAQVCHTYREYVIHKREPYDLAADVMNLSEGEKIDAVYISPDANANRDGRDTIMQQIDSRFRGKKFPSCTLADNDRVGGWMLMYQMLEKGFWKIGTNCTRLIQVLPTLVRDEKKVEDIQKVDGDDPADSARYGLKSRLGTRQAPLAERVAKHVTAEDPTIRAIQAERALAIERKATAPIMRRRGFRPRPRG